MRNFESPIETASRKPKFSLMSLAFILLIGVTPMSLNAADTAEDIAFNAAARSFQDGFFDRSEKEFAAFVNQFPMSERVPEVILRQAQSRFRLAQYQATADLLNTNLALAGKIADNYRYWTAEALYQSGKFADAVAAYEQLLKDYPESFLRSNASYGEAMSWFKMGNITNAIDRLRQPDGAFQKAAQAQPNDDYVLRGYLLLGEAFMVQKNYRQAEESLNAIANRPLYPQLDWQRLFLLVQVQLADQRADAARDNLTNLVNLATATGSRANLADTALLQGQVLQDAHQPEKAAQVYEQNLAMLPDPQRRRALSELVEIHLGLNDTAQALKCLEIIASQFPKDPEMDRIRLAQGELRLKVYYAMRRNAATTNAQAAAAASAMVLQQALTNLSQLVTNFPQSPLVGQAQLNRGWCLWESGRMIEGLAAFKEAAERLSPGTNQALARFKWADTQFELRDYAGAITNCRAILDQYGTQQDFPSALLEQSLYKIVRSATSLEPPDVTSATQAMEKILAKYPTCTNANRSILLVGQVLNDMGKPVEARKDFVELLNRYPQSSLLPETQLALARTYIKEADLAKDADIKKTNWSLAIAKYDEWVARYATNPALPRVEFDRAWINDQAGLETNALRLFTNYVVSFPKSPLAPSAQYWLGNYYFNMGKYTDAEQYYQLLYQNTNWSPGELGYQARLAAGRAAYARQGYNNATNYFLELINLLGNDTNSPPSLLPQAYIALGDTLKSKGEAYLAKSATESTNTLESFAEAITAYSKVNETNALAPRAWGLIALCHYQLGSLDATRYAKAISYYSMVTNSLMADIEARSNAEVGLGLTIEKLANGRPAPEQTVLYQAALDHYLNVVYGKILIAGSGAKGDPFWIAKAGQEAARLIETQAKWNEAVKLYERLLTVVPGSLTNAIQKKLDLAKKQQKL